MLHLVAHAGNIPFSVLDKQNAQDSKSKFIFLATGHVVQKLYSLKYSQGESQCLQDNGRFKVLVPLFPIKIRMGLKSPDCLPRPDFPSGKRVDMLRMKCSGLRLPSLPFRSGPAFLNRHPLLCNFYLQLEKSFFHPNVSI